MVPQSAITIAASIKPGQIEPLRALLQTMNSRPGFADPDNAIIPFSRLQTIHFARLAILDDATLTDLPDYGTEFPNAPVWLVLLIDCDGPARDTVAALARIAAPGLRSLFEHCEGFGASSDMRSFLVGHMLPAATAYANWLGRTVGAVREEAVLHRALRMRLPGLPPRTSARAQRMALIAAARQAGVTLTPAPATDVGWLAGEIIAALLAMLILIVALPFALVLLPLFIIEVRHRERVDKVVAPRPEAAHVATLAATEDWDVSNAFTAFGSVKPGKFRRWTIVALLWLINLTTRFIYIRGRLARVGTIHFARWVFFDDGRRLLFASNYDGSLDSYMDDFINKVAFGLNVVFTNGIGYPRTRFLVLDGAKDEQAFKNYIRRHQLPTDVWYKAYPGLTASDLAHNHAIRVGFERPFMDEAEATAWLALI